MTCNKVHVQRNREKERKREREQVPGNYHHSKATYTLKNCLC